MILIVREAICTIEQSGGISQTSAAYYFSASTVAAAEIEPAATTIEACPATVEGTHAGNSAAGQPVSREIAMGNDLPPPFVPSRTPPPSCRVRKTTFSAIFSWAVFPLLLLAAVLARNQRLLHLVAKSYGGTEARRHCRRRRSRRANP